MVKSGEYHLYRYSPSLVAAIIAIVAFAILTLLHTYRMIKSKLWFCLSFTFGGLFEFVGYIGRALGHSSPASLGLYILQTLLILVAPALFAASIYMTLGRIMRATRAEHHSPIRVNWLTKLFVLGDIISFCTQGGGGGQQASGEPDKVKMGENIILGGLFLQIVIFGLFVLVSVIFHKRLRKQPTQVSVVGDLKWQKMMMVLYAVSALILVRNVFRVVEYAGGRDGPLLRVEWPIYVFDALLMAATMVVWGVWYPTLLRPTKMMQVGNSEEGICLPNANGRAHGSATRVFVDGAYEK
ncbi:MAG: hypothetical protein Q9207_005498 [Kuettlingeria erythrocarpa]